MPTKLPRISVSLTPEAKAALDALADAAGVSASSFVGGLVHDAIPIIEATTRALVAARTQPQKAADILNEQVVKANVMLAQQQLELADAIKVRKMRRKRRT
jgi:uncharacterized protein (DUF1778 family)